MFSGFMLVKLEFRCFWGSWAASDFFCMSSEERNWSCTFFACAGVADWCWALLMASVWSLLLCKSMRASSLYHCSAVWLRTAYYGLIQKKWFMFVDSSFKIIREDRATELWIVLSVLCCELHDCWFLTLWTGVALILLCLLAHLLQIDFETNFEFAFISAGYYL